MALDELKISEAGLISINRKLLNSRRYESGLINSIGNVTIFNNKASGFSRYGYLYKTDLELPSKITISCRGTFATSDVKQVAWALVGDQTSINLSFTSNKVMISINNNIVAQFSYVDLYDGVNFSVYTTFTDNTCEAILYIQDSVLEKSVDLPETIDLSNIHDLYIGNEPKLLGDFWSGSLSLSEFSIKENNDLVYSPSSNYPLKFTKVLISDGEFKLTDKSFPIANHIYEYEISEITRSGNTVLLTSQISDDAKLEIKEIGFYANTGDREILFGSLSGFSINKGEGVPYDLIFTLNYYASFVNVVGFPDYNSFVLNDSEPCLFQDFSNVNKLMLYVFTNLERLIRMNATNIGYNRSQVFYRLQKEIVEQQECYYTIEDFEKIAFRIRKITEDIFNPNSVTVHNNLVVPENGETKNFSTGDYISSNIILNKDDSWEMKFSFKLNENSSSTILTLGNKLPIQPLIIRTNYVSGEDKTYLYAKMGKDNTTNEFILDTNIFEIHLGIRYYVKLKYVHNSRVPEDSYYEFSVSDDDEVYREVFTKYSERKMLPVESVYIGVEYSYNTATQTPSVSNPFEGIIYVNDLKITDTDGNWSPATTLIINGTQLIQFYHIPNYYKSRYVVHDLCNPDLFNIQVLETSIEGNEDLIDFSYKDGFSLCVNVDMEDNKPKILLAKTNLIDKPYFLLALLNRTLYFIINTNSKTITLSKAITDEELVSYLGNPVLLSLIIKGNSMKFYKGTDLIASFQGIFGEFKDFKFSTLRNTIQADTLRRICTDLGIGRIYDLNEYVQETLDNENRYVKNILAIQGALNINDIYYMNMLMNA